MRSNNKSKEFRFLSGPFSDSIKLPEYERVYRFARRLVMTGNHVEVPCGLQDHVVRAAALMTIEKLSMTDHEWDALVDASRAAELSEVL